MEGKMKPQITWLDQPQTFAVNRLPAHSDHKFYESEAACEAQASALTRSLNGTWQFFYSVNAGVRPENFYRPDYDRSGFRTIPVPGHIELSDYDKIHYINVMYPWEGHIFRRPAYAVDGDPRTGSFSRADYNPVGSYVRQFDLDPAMAGKRITICFDGVEQAMYLWLNGHFIGYAEDSFTPSEFDLTPYIQEKDNLLAVEVHKRSTAAFLEDQDFFRFSGIFRDVTLCAKPALHLEDVWVKPGLCEDNRSGVLELEGTLSADCPDRLRDSRIEVLLQDAQGKEIYSAVLLPGAQGAAAGNPFSAQETDDFSVSFAMDPAELGEVQSWDNHRPNLYTVLLRVISADGTVQEMVPVKTGFRRIEIKDKVIKLNGRRLILNGVNRHEWNAETGRVVTMEDMQTDIRILQENHINAVRTCHYPNQKRWYELCDEAGIYLMSETNLETHGSWQKAVGTEPSWNLPGSVPQWREAVLDRAVSNFETFKNHVSVLFWSLGNESFGGDNLADMNRYFKEKDSSRLVHYEGVVQQPQYKDRISDVESRMYDTPQGIENYLDNQPDKPFILCEYMHCMGNSLGGMQSYMDLLDKYEMYQGGFIWDYMDQAIMVTDEVTGRKVLRYGGDFDDRPANYEFSGNGILFADRTGKPALQEVRYFYGKYE